MDRRLRRVAVTAAVLVAGCGGSSPAADPPPVVTTVTTAPATTVRATTTTTCIVPNVVGKDLATTRALFAASGYKFNPHDGTQKGRTPADDWIVHSQSPGPGFNLSKDVVVYVELLRRGERYVLPGTSPCPRLAQC
jgi:hypothetical protein